MNVDPLLFEGVCVVNNGVNIRPSFFFNYTVGDGQEGHKWCIPQRDRETLKMTQTRKKGKRMSECDGMGWDEDENELKWAVTTQSAPRFFNLKITFDRKMCSLSHIKTPSTNPVLRCSQKHIESSYISRGHHINKLHKKQHSNYKRHRAHCRPFTQSLAAAPHHHSPRPLSLSLSRYVVDRHTICSSTTIHHQHRHQEDPSCSVPSHPILRGECSSNMVPQTGAFENVVVGSSSGAPPSSG